MPDTNKIQRLIYFYATAQDIAGNKSVQSNNLKVVLDTMPPQMPALMSPKNGEILTDQLVTIRGTAEQNCMVTLKINDKIYTTQADENGDYIFTFIILADGENIINISATDKAGNTQVQI